MAARKRGLGKGLDALLGPNTATDFTSVDGAEELRHIPVDLLQRSTCQPRTEFDKDSLQELSESIRQQGVVQPVIVRPLANSEKFEIIAGERRWRAAQMAALHEVPAIVRQMDDQACMCLALIENIQREDLNPLDTAAGLARLIDEFAMTHEQVSQAVGRSRAAVSNLLRLLELASPVKQLLLAGKLDMGHARALLSLPAARQLAAARQIVRQGLTVRAAEALAKDQQGTEDKKKKRAQKKDPDIQRLENALAEQLGAETAIRHQKNGRGVLRIRYNSVHELDGILARMGNKLPE